MAVAPISNSSPTSDVLHSENHSQLSAEAIAKAVARHQREHPAKSGKNVPGKTPKKG